MKSPRFQNFLSTLGAWTIETSAAIVSVFPLPLRRAVASILGWTFGHTARGMRHSLEDNLSHVLHTPLVQLEGLSDRIFKNFALTLLDFFFPEQVSIEVPDRPKLEEVRKKNKGVLVLTFHMGHWELGARTMSQWGWPVSAVYQPYSNKKFKKMIESRRAPGVNFIPVGGAAAGGVREALRNGDVVAMLGDHPFGEEGVPVKLLDHYVIWPKGPVVLAVRDKTPIVVAVIIRTGPHHYRAVVEDPLIPESKSKSEVQRLVQAVADKFGKLVTQYPDQWYRFRPFEFVEPGTKKLNKQTSKAPNLISK